MALPFAEGALLTVEVRGTRAFVKQLSRMTRRAKITLEQDLLRSALIMVGTIQRQMKGSRTRAKRKGLTPTAKPGVLGIDTGTLRRSIGSRGRGGIFKKGRTLGGGFFVDFGSAVRYAAVHEFGGRFIPRRPYFEPGIKKSLPRVNARMKGVLRIRV